MRSRGESSRSQLLFCTPLRSQPLALCRGMLATARACPAPRGTVKGACLLSQHPRHQAPEADITGPIPELEAESLCTERPGSLQYQTCPHHATTWDSSGAGWGRAGASSNSSATSLAPSWFPQHHASAASVTAAFAESRLPTLSTDSPECSQWKGMKHSNL